MQIRYDNTVDDCVEMALHYQATSPSANRQLAVLRGVLSVVILVFVTIAVRSRFGAFMAAVAAGAYFFWLPGRLRRACEKSVRRAYAGGQGRGVLGWHELTLGAAALVERSEGSETHTSYERIERIEETKRLVLIYITPTVAHMLPRQQLSTSSLAPFIAALRERVAAARARPV